MKGIVLVVDYLLHAVEHRAIHQYSQNDMLFVPEHVDQFVLAQSRTSFACATLLVVLNIFRVLSTVF